MVTSHIPLTDQLLLENIMHSRPPAVLCMPMLPSSHLRQFLTKHTGTIQVLHES